MKTVVGESDDSIEGQRQYESEMRNSIDLVACMSVVQPCCSSSRSCSRTIVDPRDPHDMSATGKRRCITNIYRNRTKKAAD